MRRSYTFRQRLDQAFIILLMLGCVAWGCFLFWAVFSFFEEEIVAAIKTFIRFLG